MSAKYCCILLTKLARKYKYVIQSHALNSYNCNHVIVPARNQAYQLMEKTKEFLRTEQISSSYYYMDADQRYFKQLFGLV
jgi:hypothetical protein